jgi:predicted pyridoxine 5'-phosphate oxidase superfamily flavin-nucleotide-binding protein
MSNDFNPEEVLGLPLMANLATVSEDGEPRNAPMWFIWEDNAILASWIKRFEFGKTHYYEP